MIVLYCLQAIPVISVGLFLISRKPILRFICIIAVLFSQFVTPILGGMVMRSVINKRIADKQWSEDYKNGFLDAMHLSERICNLSWVPIVSLVLVVVAGPTQTERKDKLKGKGDGPIT